MKVSNRKHHFILEVIVAILAFFFFIRFFLAISVFTKGICDRIVFENYFRKMVKTNSPEKKQLPVCFPFVFHFCDVAKVAIIHRNIIELFFWCWIFAILRKILWRMNILSKLSFFGGNLIAKNSIFFFNRQSLPQLPTA
jgi:hypothetical protein